MHGSSGVTSAPRGRGRFVTFRRPTILYQGDRATVTTTYFESTGHRYPVAELDDVERVETGSLLQARLFEIWARFRGERIRVFRCPDAKEFGQVCRALIRARERAGLT